jgi:hypothetical protein
LDDAEDGRVGSDRQTEGEHGDRREPGSFAKEPKAIAEIVEHLEVTIPEPRCADHPGESGLCWN